MLSISAQLTSRHPDQSLHPLLYSSWPWFSPMESAPWFSSGREYLKLASVIHSTCLRIIHAIQPVCQCPAVIKEGRVDRCIWCSTPYGREPWCKVANMARDMELNQIIRVDCHIEFCPTVKATTDITWTHISEEILCKHINSLVWTYWKPCIPT
jgi:hypothetical protein